MCISNLNILDLPYDTEFFSGYMSSFRTSHAEKYISFLIIVICKERKSLNFVKYSLECTKILQFSTMFLVKC